MRCPNWFIKGDVFDLILSLFSIKRLASFSKCDSFNELIVSDIVRIV